MPREAKLFTASAGSAVRGYLKFRANIPPRWIKNARASRKRIEPEIVESFRSFKRLRIKRPRAKVAIRNRKRIASVTLLGDALDCADLSRHTKGKPRLRKHRGYKHDLDGFKQDILEPIERAVLPSCKLVYICGNHEDWIGSDLLDEMPELDGIVNIPDVLRLAERGWQWVPVGGHIERAGFILLHGDQIGSGIHVAKKMVDSVNENCVMGHVHRYSAFSKAALVTEKKKQLGTTLPCLCTVAPAYAKNQPNAFVVGFGILEEWAYNRANLYVPIVMDGKFSFGGVIYR